jgi:quercetin dioxygenase-like cupin family protein
MPFINISTLQTGERRPGWIDRSFSSGSMTFAHFTFQAGSTIPEHCHLNEEVWTVIDGELEVTVGTDSIMAKPDFAAVVPPWTAHSVRAITDGKAIVTDCPVRTDPSGGRRGVARIHFDRPEPGSQIPFAIRNSGKTRVVVKGLKIESGIADALPPATTTETPTGDLPTLFALEPDESHDGTLAYSGLIPDLEQLLYVKGAILYDDAFGGRQHTTFCRVYNRDGFVNPNKPGYNYGS